MLTYNLMGYAVTFTDGELLYCDLLNEKIKAGHAAAKKFDQLYNECSDIEDVINQYEQIAYRVLKEFCVSSLFSQLKNHEIYDVSEQSYWKKYVTFENSQDALDTIVEKYGEILQKQGMEEDYRAMRKATRSRWQGGGIGGIDAAVKGAIDAGILNAVSGAGHSMVNAVGNMASAGAAAMSKRSLFSDASTKQILRNGIIEDIFSSYILFMKLLNEYHADTVQVTFDKDKATAFLENAKEIPAKRAELLVKSFKLFPWNKAFYFYTFGEFPNDRKVLIQAAERFDVDISSAYEKIIASEYTDLAHNSEEEALKARQRILSIMDEYGIKESPTLDTLETNCLQQLCNGLESMTEAQCNNLSEAIKAYSALDKNKQPFLQKVQKRIETLWAAEDGEIFDNLYLRTDITQRDQCQQAIDFVKSKGRTSSSEKYIAALEACTAENLKKATIYQKGVLPGIYVGLSAAFIVGSLFSLFKLGMGFFFSVALLAIGIVFGVLNANLTKNWKVLTIDNTVFHPLLMDLTSASGVKAASDFQACANKNLGLKLGLSFLFIFLLCSGLQLSAEANKETEDFPENIYEKGYEDDYEGDYANSYDNYMNDGTDSNYVSDWPADSENIIDENNDAPQYEAYPDDDAAYESDDLYDLEPPEPSFAWCTGCYYTENDMLEFTYNDCEDGNIPFYVNFSGEFTLDNCKGTLESDGFVSFIGDVAGDIVTGRLYNTSIGEILLCIDYSESPLLPIDTSFYFMAP